MGSWSSGSFSRPTDPNIAVAGPLVSDGHVTDSVPPMITAAEVVSFDPPAFAGVSQSTAIKENLTPVSPHQIEKQTASHDLINELLTGKLLLLTD